MFTTSILRVAVLSSVAILAVAGKPYAATTNCPQFNNVAFSGNMTHQSVAKYVFLKHGGDWNTYVNKWERLVEKMSATNSKKVPYFKRRLSVIRCIANEETARAQK